MSEYAAYRGKQYTIPELSNFGVVFDPTVFDVVPDYSDNPIIRDLNKPFDLERFKEARRPLIVGYVERLDLPSLSKDIGTPRILDLPIKFPGSNYRLPQEILPYYNIIRRIANHEATYNQKCYDEYYCYLTIDAGWVEPGILQREAPCHVDGFQGARWNPKVRGNHTYTVSNTLPTAYYIQPFSFDGLNESKHDFFWEMNRQAALTDSAYAEYPDDYMITMMDCYCVHRGQPATERIFRTFLRVSYEVRIFDRLGNAHNPMFKYDWGMVPRDIESLNLTAFDPECDPSLRVFPWQGLDGNERAPGAPKTQPNLKPSLTGNVTSGNVILEARDDLPQAYPVNYNPCREVAEEYNRAEIYKKAREENPTFDFMVPE